MASADEAAAGVRAAPLKRGLAAFLQRRTLVMLALGFSSGLPYLLIFDTLSAWLRESGLSLKTISAFVFATFVYAFKFVWAPVLDQVSPPGLSRWLGRRRAWLLLTQVLITAGLFAISMSDPAHRLAGLAVAATLTGFFAATQDIAMDAWRIEIAEVDAQGVMAAAYQWGFRIAMLASGVVPLVLAQSKGWPFAYAVMACLMIVGVAATLFAPTPPSDLALERGYAPRVGFATHLKRAVVDPFTDFFRRFGPAAALILALICFYRLSDFSLTIMNPFYLDLGFSKDEIAGIRKVFGVIMTTVGVFGGGWSIARFGLLRCLVVGALIAPFTHLVYAWLATQGPNPYDLALAIGLDNLAEGFAGTCLIAYMSSLTTRGSTATQYALFSSVYALLGKTLGAQSGRIIEALARLAAPGRPLAGWEGLYGRLPAGAFVSGAAKLGVPPAALGVGYSAFFLYAFCLGSVGIVLAVVVAVKRPGERAPVAPAAPQG